MPKVKCPDCKGTGDRVWHDWERDEKVIEKGECPHCNGTGYVPVKKKKEAE